MVLRMRHISTEERRARLGRRHHLAEPGESVESVAEALVAYHSTDPTTVYLSARARIDGFERRYLEAALFDDRSLVRHVGMRRTLWVLPRHLAGVVNEGCTRSLVAPERRRTAAMVERAGVADDGAAWIRSASRRTLDALRSRGEATAASLKKDVPELAEKITFYKRDGSVMTTVGMVTRMLFLLATEAKVTRARPQGTWLSGLYRWAAMDEWLGEPLESPPAAEARAELAARWLRGFGPGTVTDLAWWAGWTKSVTQRALSDADATEVAVDSGPAWVAPGDEAPSPDPGPWVRLLPSLDPTTMGWKERGWYLGGHAAELFDRNGNAGPTIWLDGRPVGAWAQRPSGEVVWEVVEAVPRDRRRHIDREARLLADWLDGTVVSPRFASPLHRRLRRDA